MTAVPIAGFASGLFEGSEELGSAELDRMSGLRCSGAARRGCGDERRQLGTEDRG
jgi:hypothetical protein